MKDSKIEWTTHTFNPWHGCVKVSPGCQHCYAETLDKRFGRAVWGPAKTTPRMGMSEAYWKQPAKWNEQALRDGTRPRVFCASMADVFEDHPGVVEWRARLWGLIEQTPQLDWLLLTKRPEKMRYMLPLAWLQSPRDNVWLGTSCEDQRRADERIPELLGTPARVRFLSCEPLLGPIDLEDAARYTRLGGAISFLDWVICGGESGPGARPMHPDWARSLRDQCQEAGVAFHFKQHGEYVHADDCPVDSHKNASLFCAGGTASTVTLYRVGKHAAGRLLDGRTWDELPV